jgi:hypothetical protein
VLSLSVTCPTRRSLWNWSTTTSEFRRSSLISRLISSRLRLGLFLQAQRSAQRRAAPGPRRMQPVVSVRFIDSLPYEAVILQTRI